MSKLPLVSGRDVVRALKKLGYAIDHQTGSHIVLRRTSSPYRRLTVPDHREMAKGTLCAIIREAGLSVEEFAELL